jgi:hypothetical protein
LLGSRKTVIITWSSEFSVQCFLLQALRIATRDLLDLYDALLEVQKGVTVFYRPCNRKIELLPGHWHFAGQA